MRSPLRRSPSIHTFLCLVGVAALGVLAAPTAAGPVRLVEADATGVTLELTLPPWSVSPNGVDERADIKVPGLKTIDSPGRAR